MRKKGSGQRKGGDGGGREGGRGQSQGSGQPGPAKPQRRIEMRFPEARGELHGDTDERRGRARPGKPGKSGPPVFNVRREDRGGRTDGRGDDVAPRVRERPVGSGRVTEEMRIAKALARSGLCSRREAERWIEEGRVKVNGETLSSPALDVSPSDKILVDGKPLPDAEPVRLWRYHKPRGLVTTHKDPEGRPTVFDNLPPYLGRVISIGRLDYNTEGLLLLTNDGALARHLELPATGWLRRYRVRAHGIVTQEQLDALKEGIEIDGVKYGPIEGTVDTVQGTNTWLTMGLREGKNREVRNILGSLNLTVNRLIRISYGPFQLLDLEEGGVEGVKRRVLAEQLGPTLAAQFGIERPEPEVTRGGKRPHKPRDETPAAKGGDKREGGDRPQRPNAGRPSAGRPQGGSGKDRERR